MVQSIEAPQRVTDKIQVAVYIVGDMGTLVLNLARYNSGDMGDNAKAIWARAWPILASAGGAAAFTFLQSIAAHAGICPAAVVTPAESGIIGAGIHTTILAMRFLGCGRV